jgi:hypothetical protein
LNFIYDDLMFLPERIIGPGAIDMGGGKRVFAPLPPECMVSDVGILGFSFTEIAFYD